MNFPIDNPSLAQALISRGYTEPTDVQRAVLGPEAKDRDLLVSAQTGSGKTVAYGLAFASTILGDLPRLPVTIAPLALVIAPTRELALQVHTELTWLYALAGGRVVSCVGGMDPQRERRALTAGCHIVVGTPGRLQDHIQRGNLNLAECEVVVLDEADEMLDLGFKEELEFILNAAPETRRTLLFSATIAKEIAALARHYQQNALRIDTVARNQPHADIEYRAIRINGHETERALVNLLRFHDSRALVFCATREAVKRIQGSLLERGFDAVALSGELTQNERNAALAALRDGRAQVCIATDVAARGLDLPDLDLVIHADLPTNKATFLHRSGRTGRAGRKGVCLVLVPHSKRRRAEMLLASANIVAIWEDPPLASVIRAKDQERMFADPLLTEPPMEEDLTLARNLLAAYEPEVIGAALIRLYRTRLPSPEEMAPPPVEFVRPAPAPRTAPVRLTDTIWFRAPVGRKHNADPKWLIPLICRLGGVTKADIGAIKVLDHETKFEIAAGIAEAFATAAAQAPGSELRFTQSSPPGLPPTGTPKPPRPPRPANANPNAEQVRRRKNKVLKAIR